MIAADGNLVWLLDRATVVVEKGAVIRLRGLMIDITRRKRAEEAVDQLTVHLESVQEEERTRIAREIHDELGQQLAGLKMRTALTAILLDSSPDEARAELAEVERHLASTIRTVRRIATDLRSPVLETLGLIPALEWLRDRFVADHGIECRTKLQFVNVDRDIAMVVYRAAQEALTNVVKHAGATTVRMDLSREGASLILEVEDDGAGFRPAASLKVSTFGLTGMRERARLLNGSITISNGESGGVLLRLVLPYKSEEESNGILSDHRRS